jgi:hypothetical protein
MRTYIRPRKNPASVARGRLGYLTQTGAPLEVIEAARRDLRVAVIENRITELLADEPPPTGEQRHRLAELLIGGAPCA